MYQIKYSYRTGDSFGSEDVEDVLEFEWENLSIVKEVLRRIQEHYEWYLYNEHPFGTKIEKPEWYKIDLKDTLITTNYPIINLPLDNGKEIQFWAPWCGYFEELYGAEIIVKEDKLLNFTIESL